jgi:flavodoxin
MRAKMNFFSPYLTEEYPTWWYDLQQVMYSFFDEYDFSGKTIIPFNSANGSRFSSTIRTIQSLEPNATVITDGL